MPNRDPPSTCVLPALHIDAVLGLGLSQDEERSLCSHARKLKDHADAKRADDACANGDVMN